MQGSRELIEVKFGTDALGDQDRINSHAERLAPLHETHDLLIVSSGAVARGESRVKAMGGSLGIYDKQTVAMLGTASINRAWEQAFEEVGLLAGQILVTHRELQDSKEGPYFRRAHAQIRSRRVVGVLNHQDFLSGPQDKDNEIQGLEDYSDNDRLARAVAVDLGAKTLIFATNGKEGCMVKDHNGGEKLKKVIRVDEIQAFKEDHVYEPSKSGTGGLGSKLDESEKAVAAGIRTFICSADANFAAIVAGQQICTEVVQ